MTDALKKRIVEECMRQEENAAYTATTLHIWLRALRFRKQCFLASQLVLAALAALFAANGNAILAGSFGAIAGVAPSVWDALKLEESVEVVARHAAEFTNMRDRFRRVRLIDETRSLAEFEAAFNAAISQMNLLRSASITPPERLFKQAQQKVASGDYNYSIDSPPKTN